jgi:hypothetical protein
MALSLPGCHSPHLVPPRTASLSPFPRRFTSAALKFGLLASRARSDLPSPPPHLSVSSVDRHGCNRIRSNCTQLLHVVSPTERALHGRPSREPFNECSSEAVICTVCSYWSARCNVIFAPRAVLLRVNNATQSRKPRNFHLERSLHPPLDLHNTPVKTTRAEICR